MREAASGVEDPVVPDYSGACVSNLVPALLSHRSIGEGWLPAEVLDAERVVLVVLDGLGALQLDELASLAPTMSSIRTGHLTTVAPSTTASALTSISTGLSPGEHGIVGYKVWVGGEVVNMLRWTSAAGDRSDTIGPGDVQPNEPFLGHGPPTVGPSAFERSSFTVAHLRGADYRGYVLPSSMALEIRSALDCGATFVHAYYDGLDKMAHLRGLGPHYEAELAYVDHLVAGILEALPTETALVVTSDHGQVQVGDSLVAISSDALAMSTHLSGEPRFVWLHARGGRARDVLDAATGAHCGHAWVCPVEQVIDERWLGPVGAPARSRLGDVALVAREPVALVDPAVPTALLEARHGSMTPAEMFVPLLTTTR